MLRAIFLYCFFLIILVSIESSQSINIAANLDGIADWSRTLPFVNLVRQSRKFGSPNTPWDGICPVDSQGWPTQDFGVILEDSQVDCGGTLLLKCTGNATISVLMRDGTVENLKYDESSNTLTANIVVPHGTDRVFMSFTNTKGGVKNLQILQPGYSWDRADDFTDLWYKMLDKFAYFRYMDWASTNDNPVVDWSDRTPPDHPSFAYGPKGKTGVPWESCIQLANNAKKDMWINIPHQATDEYVKQLALLFKQKLDPARNLYLEYSNEVWNWQFSQSHWNYNAAVAEVKAGDPNHLNYDLGNNTYYWGYRRVALRLKQITDTFAEVFGKDTINKRIRPVLAGQVVQPLIVRLGLEYMDAVWGPPKNWFWGIAGAPYFNLGKTNDNPNMTVNDVLEAFETSISSMSAENGVGRDNWLAGNAAVARWYGLKMHGYEGGPDTFGPNGIEAKKEATLDARMEGICTKYLDAWYSYGFEELNWFVAGADGYITKYGTWALTNDMKNFSVPKMKAIDDINAASMPPLKAGLAIPATINASYYVEHPVPLKDPYLRYLNNGSHYDYLLRTTKAMSMKLTISFAAKNSGTYLQVIVNNENSYKVAVPAGDGKNFMPATPITIKVDEGLNVVRIIILATREYNIDILKFDVA